VKEGKLDQLVLLEQLDQLGHEDSLEIVVKEVNLDLLVNLEEMVNEVLKVSPAGEENLDRQGNQENRVQQEEWDQLDSVDHVDHQEKLVNKENQDHLEDQVHKVQEAQLVNQEKGDLLDP